ncbi:hypothetical protein J3E07_000772 [Methanococcus voltae]|uniref:Uncharacterized protein n=1 Tax=Methanococcus voltae TaxID=2188 RepID=A0A8J7S4I3_METVO|nr:hypothetical protein [Methanococcus voltae]MBP2201360.1 hypothetical protein [Methanococcus voltae]
MDNFKVTSHYFNESTNDLRLTINNYDDNLKTVNTYDVYSQNFKTIYIDKGQNNYTFNNVKLKGGKFFIALYNDNGMILYKKEAYSLALPDKIYLASIYAITFFSAQMVAVATIFFIISLMITKKLLIENLLMDRVAQAFPVIILNVIIDCLLIMIYNNYYGIHIIFSYGNWIIPIISVAGYTIGFKLFNVKYISLLHYDFENNYRKLLRVPYVEKESKIIVRWIDNKIKEIILPKVNNSKLYDDLLDFDGELYEITSYEVEEYPTKVYNEETFWNRILTKLEKLQDYSRDYLRGTITGKITVEHSKIMDKEIQESVHLKGSLEALNDRLYKLYGEICKLKNARGNDVVNLAQHGVNVIMSTLPNTQQYSDFIVEHFNDMVEEEDENYKIETKNEVENGEGATNGDGQPNS